MIHRFVVDRFNLSENSMQDSVVSGLVITLKQTPEARDRLLAELRAHGAIQIGAIKECWLAVAVEARDERESHDIHDWIATREGVEYVDLVSLSFDPQMSGTPEISSTQTEPEFATR